MNSSLSVNDLSSFFAARQHVLAALLFGSFATGRANMQSDLDIAVIPDNPLSANQTMALVRDLAMQFGRPVDVIDLAVQHGPVASALPAPCPETVTQMRRTTTGTQARRRTKKKTDPRRLEKKDVVKMCANANCI